MSTFSVALTGYLGIGVMLAGVFGGIVFVARRHPDRRERAAFGADLDRALGGVPLLAVLALLAVAWPYPVWWALSGRGRS